METTGFKVNIEKEYLLEYPKSLKVYTFDRGDISRYPEPVLDSANVLSKLKKKLKSIILPCDFRIFFSI